MQDVSFNQFRECELGQYIDRLLAKEIVAITQKYQAGSRASNLSSLTNNLLLYKLKKAAPRFELGVEVLQTSALPLGYAAVTPEI